MCLDYELPKKKLDEIIQQARKRGYIRVYKVCDFHRTGCIYWLGGKVSYKRGLQKAKRLREKDAGWYAFLSKPAAKRYKVPNEFIKICFTKAKWIKQLGKDFYTGDQAGIFTHLAFPDWNKGDMTVREFKQICKECKGK